MASTSEPIAWSHGNNSATVRALLINRLQSGQEPRGPVHPYYQPWSVKALAPQQQQAKAEQSSSKVAGSSASPPPGCPMHAGGGGMGGGSSSNNESGGESSKSGFLGSSAAALNPLNKIPTLTQDRAPNQKVELSTERVMSTIPRLHESAPKGGHPYEKGGNASACPVPHDERTAIMENNKKESNESSAGNWEYPSPQQFYNALVRKGWETPEEHVEMMVLVHNFLNERAWQEVLDWERDMGVKDAQNQIALARFQGKPGTLSPKARIFSWAAMIAPSKFSSEAPFDRHDWVVRRPATSSTEPGKEVRYVIDYYSAPDDPDTDEPVFHLDVRPALDSWEAAQARMKRTWAEWRSQEAETSS